MIPKIGIASNHLLHPTERFKTNYVDYIQKAYVDGVRQSGGLPLVFPLGYSAEAKSYLELVDALLLAGGQDVSPALYGTEPIKALGETDLARDKFEIALVKEAIRQQKPILGICRGQQLVNVALGGTLFQDLSSQKQISTVHNQFPTDFDIQTHYITTNQQSWISNLFGQRLFVNSFHHQAVNKLGSGLSVVARSDDNIIEALESNDGNIFTVQFHPECLFKAHSEFSQIFAYLIQKAVAARKN
ncbi:gamma-glutamyl-gamma-aminobutyrate hydrolase family protein [Liquorilactobacillus capillatus]|uniref:Gamma-glutamyl-gamma-aminobutyrate hydrolase n=1 Tax=Liquorilactobacillus capillatus DSM 19910 TaxID=1423731 RepID=A0A0R1M5K5_9LACO|nr:gamma-glutamyl-gamma-aminobutyrate hydrolase family protein [Liquorilactobacillus capillatus]KRL03145.1 gamma-glutamyl-gamma-aminobutyrate hydrolase [Liquorilactobacillus capillatus DSM 19910]